MNLVDLMVIGLVVATGAAGWRLGLVNRALSWLFMIIAVLLAALLVPVLLEVFSGLQQNWLVAGAVLLMVVFVLLGQSLGLLVGDRLRIRYRTERTHTLDQFGGAAFGAAGLLAMVWLVTPAILAVPGWLADQTATSATTRLLDRALPEPPDTFSALQNIVGTDTFSLVFSEAAPAVEVGPPPAELSIPPAAMGVVSQAVVRIEAIACGQRQDGTGFFIGPGLVLTNAHVVAGSERITVIPSVVGDEPAEIVGYDSSRDLAVLRVAPDDHPSLTIGEGAAGQLVTAFGHPLGGTLRAEPAQLAERVLARGRDLYDDVDIQRRVFFVAASLKPGDSGGPVVDHTGAVVAIIFAIAPDDSNVAFALIGEEITAFLSEADLSAESDSGDCI
jgi:S1-C subfamily serine protease